MEGLKVDNFGTLPTVSTAPLKTPAPRWLVRTGTWLGLVGKPVGTGEGFHKNVGESRWLNGKVAWIDTYFFDSLRDGCCFQNSVLACDGGVVGIGSTNAEHLGSRSHTGEFAVRHMMGFQNIYSKSIHF